MIVIDYLAFILLLFFITFFLNVFVKYFKTKMITPHKMFTHKKGGLFEHYIIVGIIAAVVITLHVGLGLQPFPKEGEPYNWLSFSMNMLSFLIVGFIFLVFIFIFLSYFISFIITSALGKNRREFYRNHAHKMVVGSFTAAMVAIIVFGIWTIILNLS